MTTDEWKKRYARGTKPVRYGMQPPLRWSKLVADGLLLYREPSAIEMHASGHCFSLMVNFDAIGKYFRVPGGEALLPDKHSSGLSLC